MWVSGAGFRIVALALVILATLMALGMSWSHIQRRLTGQLDVEMED